jgi:hypothetical protein
MAGLVPAISLRAFAVDVESLSPLVMPGLVPGISLR